MKKGIRGHDVGADGLKNICEKCRQNKIEYLQLVLEKSVDGFSVGKFSKEYASSLKNELKGMKIAILGSYINPSNPDDEGVFCDITKFKEKIRYASILKPIAVGTETGTYKSGLTDSEEAYQRVLSTFKELLREAEKYDVNIGIEGVYCFVINTPQKMKRLVDDLNSPNVKVIFDPANYININNYAVQDEIIKETFDLLADKICVIHAKDFTVEDGKIKNAGLTEGILNYKLIFEKLKEKDLDIPIICEGMGMEEAVSGLEKLQKLKDKI